jgi:hypothetical protein
MSNAKFSLIWVLRLKLLGNWRQRQAPKDLKFNNFMLLITIITNLWLCCQRLTKHIILTSIFRERSRTFILLLTIYKIWWRRNTELSRHRCLVQTIRQHSQYYTFGWECPCRHSRALQCHPASSSAEASSTCCDRSSTPCKVWLR